MKIERIDDKTVKCFLSNEEMDNYGITYKDFVIRSEKAKTVMEEIIGQAEEEVGYQPPQFSFDLQIMMLPDQGMLLTFSEKEPDEKKPEELLKCLKEMQQVLETKKEDKESGRIELHKETKIQPKQEMDPRPTFAVFAFADLNGVCDYASVLPGNLRISSALYQMGEEYYLYLDKGAASYERYSRACIQAMEFGEIYTAEHEQVTYLKEHGECLIADHAVKKLKF